MQAWFLMGKLICVSLSPVCWLAPHWFSESGSGLHLPWHAERFPILTSVSSWVGMKEWETLLLSQDAKPTAIPTAAGQSDSHNCHSSLSQQLLQSRQCSNKQIQMHIVVQISLMGGHFSLKWLFKVPVFYKLWPDHFGKWLEVHICQEGNAGSVYGSGLAGVTLFTLTFHWLKLSHLATPNCQIVCKYCIIVFSA